MSDRSDWPEIFLDIAEFIAEKRSTCPRLHVGAIIAPPDHRQILSFGFNGNWAGGPNACDDPTAAGACGCVHGEANALLKCDNTMPGRILYLTHAPCRNCAKLIINAGIAKVVYRNAYRSQDGVDLLQEAGVTVKHMGGR